MIFLLDSNVISEMRKPRPHGGVAAWFKVWQIVDINAAIAREWSRLVERRNRALFEDAMIAATARILNLIIVTRNVKHFTQFGVKLLNPFEPNPTVLGAPPIE